MIKKRFNITGVCIPEKHFMVDTSHKILQIIKMVEEGDYFVINRPRQYGKTTTLYLLEQELKKNSHYLVIDITFEGIDQLTYSDQNLFIPTFLDLIRKPLELKKEVDLIDFIDSQKSIPNFNNLSNLITRFVEKSKRRVVLLIDEIDKSSNNPILFDFLGMLRAKFLKCKEGKDYTFHSVILAGVQDVKTLKSKIRPNTDAGYHSPWNIAVDFEIDLSFSPNEIASMLNVFIKEQNAIIDIPSFSEKLFYWTSGYPFLISLLCKIIDEKIIPTKQSNEWTEDDLRKALQIAFNNDNTNFESLIKNLENNPDLYEFVFNLIIEGTQFLFNLNNPIIHLGLLFGILKEESGRVRVHNRIYEQIIYNYMSSVLETSGHAKINKITDAYLDATQRLEIKKIILKFQEFMNQQYSSKDKDFIERNGRLLFLAFIRPIINGRGFDFKEVQISEEKRLDIIITFDNRKYIIELKIWRGEAYHKEGIHQLCDYLDRQNESTGYLLIYDLRKESGLVGKSQEQEYSGKKIFTAWV